jgi:hypothetical protein
VLFDAAGIWHSGTFNDSPGPRVAVTAKIDPATRRVSLLPGVAGAPWPDRQWNT